jgi:hypothetical protein
VTLEPNFEAAFASAQKVADAVLYEGYLLYPYRSSSAKQQVRWQFGVFVPPGFTGTAEASACQTECLLEAGENAKLALRIRFLHVQSRTVEPGEVLIVDGIEHRAFDEAVEVAHDIEVRVSDVHSATESLETEFGVDVPGDMSREPLGDGFVIRERWPISLVVRVGATPLPGPYGLVRLRIRVENVTPWDAPEGPRPDALRRSLVAAHVLMAVSGGSFVSMLEPPEWARPAVAGCENQHTWPVLIGDGHDAMLSSPIILYDQPEIAPESQGDLFDALEIDEILSLRTLALTDDEKRQARGTDAKAAEIIDRVENMPQELMDKLHGAIKAAGPRRGWGQSPAPHIEQYGGVPDDFEAPAFDTRGAPWWDPGADASVSPETDSVVVAGTPVAKGSRLRLHPRLSGADAQDMFLDGRIGVVEAVLVDVDGGHHLAVTLEDDPGADLARLQGRFSYFSPEEVEPLK